MTNIEAAALLVKLYTNYVTRGAGHWDEAAEAVAMACMALKEKNVVMRSSIFDGPDASKMFKPPVGPL